MDTVHHSTSHSWVLLSRCDFSGAGRGFGGYGGCQMLHACSGWVHLHPAHSHSPTPPVLFLHPLFLRGSKAPQMPQQYCHIGISLSLSPQLFQQFGNMMANHFWAANVPPSEAISPTSCSQERRRFIIAKYREGKYRHYHPLFGNQEELNRVSDPQGWAPASGLCLGTKWWWAGLLRLFWE